MLNRLLEFSIRQRVFVVFATFVLIGVGGWSALRLPMDAVPDITNVQVQINTAVPALAAEESEILVTRPDENRVGQIVGHHGHGSTQDRLPSGLHRSRRWRRPGRRYLLSIGQRENSGQLLAGSGPRNLAARGPPISR